MQLKSMIKMKKSSYLVILLAVVIISGIFLPGMFKSPVVPLVRYSKKLNNFSVIVAQEGSYVFVVAQLGDVTNPTYSYTKLKNEINTPPSFGVRNDTLFVFSTSGKEHRLIGNFNCTHIKSIIGMDRSVIHLNYLLIDSLEIKLSHAKFFGNFDITRDKFKILNLKADSSKIDLSSSFHVGQINLQLNRSHLKFSVPRKNSCSVDGSLENYSRLIIENGIPEGKVDKDATSYSNF